MLESMFLWDRSRRSLDPPKADLSAQALPWWGPPVSRLPRLRDFDYRGRYAYFLTFCTRERRAVFRDASVASMVVEQILRAARRFEFEVLAYCLMPDHVHLLVHGRSERSDLHRFVKRAKQSSGQIYAHAAQQPLWQDSYYDHVVRPEENLAGIARYIIENPVRAGLVTSPFDYRFVGSCTWSIEELLKDC
jgi:putative transposase